MRPFPHQPFSDVITYSIWLVYNAHALTCINHNVRVCVCELINVQVCACKFISSLLFLVNIFLLVSAAYNYHVALCGWFFWHAHVGSCVHMYNCVCVCVCVCVCAHFPAALIIAVFSSEISS